MFPTSLPKRCSKKRKEDIETSVRRLVWICWDLLLMTRINFKKENAMSAELLRSKLEGSGLIDTLDGMVNGNIPIVDTFSAGDICGFMCASCIIGFMVY